MSRCTRMSRLVGAAVLGLVSLCLSVAPPSAAASGAGSGELTSVDPRRSAIVFIEFQNEWLDPTAPLNKLMKDREQFTAAVANAAKIIEQARRRGVPVVHAGLSLVNDPTYQIFGRGDGKHGLRGAIPKAGTWRNPQRVTFPEPFTPRPGEFIVGGRSGASVITNSNLDAYLRNNGIDRIYLLGFALHVCVESTLRQAHDLGYDVTVIGDAAPAFTAEQRRHVLEDVVHHFGEQMTTAQLLDALTKAQAAPAAERAAK